MRLLGVVILLLIASAVGYAEDTMTGVFAPEFKTLRVQLEGNDQALPVITLGGNERIEISFDELAEDRNYLRYSLVHCNADWQPSGLVDPEFIDGFNVADVEDYAFSEATTVHYVHYRISMPNDDMRITASGNYLLRVYPENEPEQTLLQARFSVTEYRMKVGASVTSRTDVDYNNRHQQLSVVVDTEDFNVHDVYNDIKVVVTQDGRVDNEVMLNAPMRVAGRKVYYEHLRPLIFKAGNEYRRMETVSTTYPGMGVEEVAYAAPYYHQLLYVDSPRVGQNYSYDQTQFGRFRVREYNSDDSDVEADYVVTHFSLAMPEQPNYDIFLDGDFTYRRFNPSSRMIYNREREMYEATLLLKQGAYNYQYLAVPSGSMKGETSVVEGDYYPTIHEYTIKVYCRVPSERYDRLVATTAAYSGR